MHNRMMVGHNKLPNCHSALSGMYDKSIRNDDKLEKCYNKLEILHQVCIVHDDLPSVYCVKLIRIDDKLQKCDDKLQILHHKLQKCYNKLIKIDDVFALACREVLFL